MPAKKPSTRDPLRDSWLPTQMLLQPNAERDDTEIDDLDLSKMDEDPLIYFLTPTPSSTSYDDDNDMMDFDMEFDAGIEDAKHPPPIVRSVSPSSLGGLSRPPPPRPPTPPRSPATPELELDMYGTPDEQYDYLQPASPSPGAGGLGVGFPRRLKGLAAGKFKNHAGGIGGVDALSPLGPAPHSPDFSNRGRAITRPGGSSGTRRARGSGSGSGSGGGSGMPGRLSPHAWREPSPDVWSIEEETEEEVGGGVGVGSFGSIVGSVGSIGSEMGLSQSGVLGSARTRAVDIPAAKPKKRVRFVLPDGSTI